MSLSNNQLMSLSRSVLHLQKSLTNLSLAENLLSETDEHCFANLRKLQILEILNNRITNISR